jgi:integrase
VKATAALATGATHDEAAAAAGVSTHAMRDWARSYPEFWSFAYDQAMQTASKIVRDQAGTDAIFQDPERFIRAGNRCIKWTEARGELLFSANEMTLTRFYETQFKPRRFGTARPATIERYDGLLRRWAIVTGDPSLPLITDEVVCKFREFSARVTNSPNSVRTGLKHIQAVLDAAGPRGRRNRDGAAILVDVPYARPPKEIFHVPRIWSLDQISDLYRATVAMEVPIAFGFKPPAWWKSLLVMAYCTALRRRALLSICMSDINWKERSLLVRPEYVKTGRGMILPLPDVAIEHLRSIRTDRQRIFSWPHNIGHFHTCFRRLTAAAGITSQGKVGLHTLRRSVATVLFERDPAAAQLLLGHSNVTIKHYVRSDKILRRAIDSLPMPEAFTETFDTFGQPGRSLATVADAAGDVVTSEEGAAA